MKGIKGDMWLALCVIALAAAYLYSDMQLPEVRLSDPLGPKAFPALVGIGLLVSALLLIVETWRKQRAASHESVDGQSRPVNEGEGHGEEPATKLNPLVLVAVVAWTALYYLCFEPVGYILATVVFLMGMLSYFNRNRLKTNIAVALGTTFFFDLLFTLLLGVPMPAGLLPI